MFSEGGLQKHPSQVESQEHTHSLCSCHVYFTSAEISHLAKSKVSGHEVYSPFSLLGSTSNHKKGGKSKEERIPTTLSHRHLWGKTDKVFESSVHCRVMQMLSLGW